MYGLGCMVQGLGFSGYDLGSMVYGVGCMVEGLGYMV